jgi:N-acetylglucosamine-6-phosphate deacetylase
VDGCLRLDDGTLAGSVLTMDEAVRYAVKVAQIELGDALAMASRVPATFLRREAELGRIAPGHLASLVHLDDDLRVLDTWIEGQSTADGTGASGAVSIESD